MNNSERKQHFLNWLNEKTVVNAEWLTVQLDGFEFLTSLELLIKNKIQIGKPGERMINSYTFTNNDKYIDLAKWSGLMYDDLITNTELNSLISKYDCDYSK